VNSTEWHGKERIEWRLSRVHSRFRKNNSPQWQHITRTHMPPQNKYVFRKLNTTITGHGCQKGGGRQVGQNSLEF